MVTREQAWPAGYPCWVDLMTSDVDAALEFYSTLFGWTIQAAPAGAGGYRIAQLDGRSAAAVGPAPRGQEGHPSVWTTYLASDDVDATCTAITAAGGIVLGQPTDVMDAGRLAIAQDPTGGTFGLWQAGTRIGAGVVNEPGAFTWNELMTRDYESAKAFYGTVFGYQFTELGDENFRYSTIDLDGRPAGGLGELAQQVPREVPAHWRVYFAVEDTDAAMAQATALGGRVLRPAEDMPHGRWGDVSDGQGAMFTIITTASGPE